MCLSGFRLEGVGVVSNPGVVSSLVGSILEENYQVTSPAIGVLVTYWTPGPAGGLEVKEGNDTQQCSVQSVCPTPLSRVPGCGSRHVTWFLPPNNPTLHVKVILRGDIVQDPWLRVEANLHLEVE